MDFEISIEKVKNSRIQEFDTENIGFGKIFCDHMFVSDWDGEKWSRWEGDTIKVDAWRGITEVQNLSIELDNWHKEVDSLIIKARFLSAPPTDFAADSNIAKSGFPNSFKGVGTAITTTSLSEINE